MEKGASSGHIPKFSNALPRSPFQARNYRRIVVVVLNCGLARVLNGAIDYSPCSMGDGMTRVLTRRARMEGKEFHRRPAAQAVHSKSGRFDMSQALALT